MTKGTAALKDNSTCMRKRIYWKTPDGLEHGFVKKENGSIFEVYSYSAGKVVQVAQKDIARVITEEL